jgi:hypothetical protein
MLPTPQKTTMTHWVMVVFIYLGILRNGVLVLGQQ